ncbi:MAG: hypothetical protein H6732_04885 [Alphaproteobacteria bacterium]|nr:hypothetical protein [Alphaproteobacteria bacterium]
MSSTPVVPDQGSGPGDATAGDALARFVDPDARPLPVRPAEGVAWLLLLAFLVVSRWGVAPDFLLEWDSANYALAIQHFDVFEHQPHAPGSPVFVLLLDLAALLGDGTVTPFLVVNALLGATALLGVAYLVRRVAGPWGAWLAAAGVALSPPFWYHGAASTAYVAECFLSVSTAALAVAMARGRLALPWGMLLAALAMGIRPSGVVTLLPVVIVGAALARPRPRDWMVGAIAGAVGMLAWAVPTVVLSGGWTRFAAANDALSDWQLELGSILVGDLSQVVPRSTRLGRYLFDAANALWPVMLVALVVRGRSATHALPRGTLLFFAAWILPGTAIYVFHHLAKSGYVLTLVPVFFTVLALAVASALQVLGDADRRRAAQGLGLMATVYVALNLAGFWYAIPPDLLLRKDAYWSDLPSHVMLTGDYGRFGLRYRTHAAQNVDRLVDGLDPEEDLVVFLFGSHELHRLQLYYHPDHWLVAASVDHGLAHETGTDTTFGEFQLVVLRATRDGMSWAEPTHVLASDGVLDLERVERALPLPLRREPRRIVVIYTCPPCFLPLGPGVVEIAHPHIGAGFRAAVLAPECPIGEAADNAATQVKFSLAGAACMQ